MHSNVLLMIVIVVLVLALLAWLFVASRRTRVEFTRPGEDNAPARRNQALIDAPPATATAAATAPLADVGVVVPPIPVPVTEPAAAAEQRDDLTRLKGVGPKLAAQLRTLGVTRFTQVAAWTDADIDRIDAQLGRFQGRIRRDDWPAQARLLAAGDTAGYEARFGKL